VESFGGAGVVEPHVILLKTLSTNGFKSVLADRHSPGFNPNPTAKISMFVGRQSMSDEYALIRE